MSKRRLKMLAAFLIANLSVVLISVIYTLLARGGAGGLLAAPSMRGRGFTARAAGAHARFIIFSGLIL